MQALRDATQALHAQLDSQLPLARPADARQSLGHYHGHLRVLHGWLQDLAPLLQRAGWGLDPLEPLRADLAEAGLAGDPPGQAGPLPGTDIAHAWGVAYVVEGSQLGGRVLFQRLRRAGVQAPLRYLEGRGPGTGAHWNGFLQALRTALAQPAEVQAACQAACWAFEDLLARFRRQGMVP
ncbi:biliverdin-producing heme oxygenase [Pseudorhodoferax sp.]|uniref:biliverdin-producing heme oxygenase n=1 Tax=Pseudorhodoferax sp. TaxID=1993553 RepID=UPI002DD6AEC8|nr:biliverdin-producing heme oxygenase [Pseudorhodoferax sp.]